ncbi:MAG TPA: hypothetical protein VJK04_00420 [Candidatus Paceibacterota bacterium]
MLKNITPDAYRCFGGLGCSAVFVKKEVVDITPDAYRCAVGPCPGVFSQNETIYLVGKKVERVGEFAEILVGEDEELVSLPLGLLRVVKFPE